MGSVLKMKGSSGGHSLAGAFGLVFTAVALILGGVAWFAGRVGVWLWTDIRPLVFSYRRMLWPLALLDALWLTRGLVAELPLRTIVVYGLLVCVAVIFYVRRSLKRGLEWLYTCSALTLSLSYIAFYSVYDVRWMNQLAYLVWGAFAAFWWAHHPTRFGTRTLSSILEKWIVNVRDRKGSPLEGVELSAPCDFENGIAFLLQMIPGKHSFENVLSALPKISTGIGVLMENLVVESPHPDYPEDPSKARLEVVTRSPIKETVYFDRPRHEDGRVMLGPHADGRGDAWLKLYTANSMWSTIVIGDTGSGKSRLVETAVVSIMDLRNVGQHTVVFYMDGQNGASSPSLTESADWAVGQDGVLKMLAALERIAEWRSRTGGGKFTPSAERPGILVVIDECQDVFELAGKRFAKAARTWRKVGMSFLAASQDSSMKVFAGEDQLRTALLAGNGVVLRLSSRVAKGLIPRLGDDGLDPIRFPAMPGYAVVVAGERAAPFRSRFSPDQDDHDRGKHLKAETIESWFAKYPALGLDPGSAHAAGADYANRHADEMDEETSDEDGSPGVGPHSGSGPSGGVPPDNVGRVAEQILQVLAMEWSGAQRDLSLQEIYEQLPEDVKYPTMKTVLGDLVKSGKVERPKHGHYRIAKVTVAS